MNTMQSLIDNAPSITEAYDSCTNRSVKGGAVFLGMRKALADKTVTGKHIIIDTNRVHTQINYSDAIRWSAVHAPTQSFPSAS